MKRKNQRGQALNKRMVFDAARSIAASSEMPTLKNIREYLGGKGGETTLHKYLSQWKIELLKIAVRIEDPSALEREDTTFLLQQKNHLERALSDQTTQNKIISAELIKSEKENVVLKDEAQVLKQDLQRNTEENKILALKCQHLEKMCQKIEADRGIIAESIMRDKNKQIEALHQELKEVNKYSLDKVKSLGFEGDDALIRERVKSIHLEDKLKLLTEQIKTLEADLKKQQEVNQPLMQQIQKQKAFIEKTVTWEQLQAFEKLNGKG